jgi:DNA-binding transcriptional LysR family regulator
VTQKVMPFGDFVGAMPAARWPASGGNRGPAGPKRSHKHARPVSGGAIPFWEFERDGEIVCVDPPGPLQVRSGAAFDLALQAALDGLGIIHLFEDWLHPHLDSGALVPLLEPWCQRFSGPLLYYAGRRHLPSPLRAFGEFVRER